MKLRASAWGDRTTDGFGHSPINGGQSGEVISMYESETLSFRVGPI